MIKSDQPFKNYGSAV